MTISQAVTRIAMRQNRLKNFTDEKEPLSSLY
jgi:hypothetical protein